jgi:hypothetical protein
VKLPHLLLSALLALAPAAHAGADFNGTTGFYELASNLGFAGDADFPITVSCWIRPDSVSGTDAAFAIEDKGDRDRAAAWLSGSTFQANVSASGAVSTTHSASKAATAGRPYHVVAVLDDTAALTFIWVDGSFLGGGSGTTRVLADLDTTALGCTFSGASAPQTFLDGVIYDVAVWSGALTEAEVQRLTLDRHSVRSVRPERLVLHCSGTSITGTICTDTVGLRSFTKNGTITDSGDEGPNGFTPPGLGTWTPADLTPAVWLKGDAGVTGSAPVTAWADQSGNGNDLDNTGTGAPAATTDGYGGKGGIQFTSDSLYGEPAPVDVAPFYGFAVINPAVTSSGDSFLWIGDKDSDGENWLLSSTSNAGILSFRATSAGGGADLATISGAGQEGLGTVSLEFDEASSTSRRISVNAGQQGTNTASNSPAGADRFAVGRTEDATPNGPWSGTLTLYELVIATTAPTDAQRNLWSVYVRQTHGVRGGAWRRE